MKGVFFFGVGAGLQRLLIIHPRLFYPTFQQKLVSGTFRYSPRTANRTNKDSLLHLKKIEECGRMEPGRVRVRVRARVGEGVAFLFAVVQKERGREEEQDGRG